MVGSDHLPIACSIKVYIPDFNLKDCYNLDNYCNFYINWSKLPVNEIKQISINATYFVLNSGLTNGLVALCLRNI